MFYDFYNAELFIIWMTIGATILAESVKTKLLDDPRACVTWSCFRSVYYLYVLQYPICLPFYLLCNLFQHRTKKYGNHCRTKSTYLLHAAGNKKIFLKWLRSDLTRNSFINLDNHCKFSWKTKIRKAFLKPNLLKRRNKVNLDLLTHSLGMTFKKSPAGCASICYL